MITRALLEELADFDTPLLANTIGYIDPTPPERWYMGGAIRSLTPSLGPIVGIKAQHVSIPAGHDRVACQNEREATIT